MMMKELDEKTNERKELEKITKKLDKKFPDARIGFKARIGEKWYRKSRVGKDESLWVQDKYRSNINYSIEF